VSDSLTQVFEGRIQRLESDLSKAREVQANLAASLTKANAIIAQMQEARVKRNDRWAYLLGQVAQERDEQIRIASSLKLEVESLRNRAFAISETTTAEEIAELNAHLEKLTPNQTQTKPKPKPNHDHQHPDPRHPRRRRS